MDEDFCNDYRFGGDLETSLQTLILPDYLLKKKLPLKAYFLINISIEKLKIKKKNTVHNTLSFTLTLCRQLFIREKPNF